MTTIRCSLRYILLCFLLTGLALGTWSILIEPGRILFKTHRVEVAGWPKELGGYRVALITDLHAGSPHITLDKVRHIVQQTNALHPELILLGGDYVIQGVVGGTPIPSAEIVKELSPLQAQDGVFGVLGNHDWWDNAPRMQHEFNAHRIAMLEDRAQRITVRNHHFWLVGVSDYTEGAHNVAKALSRVDDGAPILMLSHSPDIFPDVPEHVGITIAGHTHGGQVYVPFFGRPIVPSRYGARYARGLIHEGRKQIFVGTGIGTSILPIRFMTPPEVSIPEIHPPTLHKEP